MSTASGAFDPTKLISTPDQAVTAANTMMQRSAVGLGSGIDQVSDGGIWESKTEGPLAAMLYAASPKGNNAGIEWVLLAVDMRLEDPDSQMSLEPAPPRPAHRRVDQLLAETAGSWSDAAAAVMEDPTLLFGDRPDHEETNGFIDRLIAQTER